MKTKFKILGSLSFLTAITNTVFASTISKGISNLASTWPYYVAVALIVSAFVTFSLIITGIAKDKKKVMDNGLKKYLVTIAVIQLLVIGIIPLIVLGNYVGYKPFREIGLVNTVWNKRTNINALEVTVYDKNRTPREGMKIVDPKEKIELLEMISRFEMKPKGFPQLSQRAAVSKWYGQCVEIKNIVTDTMIILEYDDPYCCINNIQYQPKDSMSEKELGIFIEDKFIEYNSYINM